MADDIEIEEVADTSPPPVETPVATDEDGFFEKMRTNLEKWGIIKARASKDAIAQAAKMLGVDPKKMAKMYGAMMEDEEEPMEMSKSDPPPPQEPQMTKEDLQKAIEAAQAAQLDALLEKAKTELEKGYQEKIVTLEKQVEDLSKEASDQRTRREEREFLEKAMTFQCFPLSYTELGGMLHGLSKAVDSETYGKWEAALKAADKQLFAAGIFNEMGTSRSPEEVEALSKVEKMAADKGISYKEALLSLSPAEQRKLLEED